MKRNLQGKRVINIPFTLASIIITLVIAIIPAVVAYGVLTEKVDNLETTYARDLPQYTETIKNIEYRLIELEKNTIGTEVSLQEIKKDVDEIKMDLKELLKELKSHPEGY